MVDLKNMSKEELAVRRARAYDNRTEVARVAGGPLLIFDRTDNGNCRVYYRMVHANRRHGALRCFQEDRPGEFTYYVCSKDGEPEVDGKTRLPIDKLPADDSATALAFRKWWETVETPRRKPA